MEENQGSPQGFYAQPLLGCEVELYPSWIPMVGLIVESMLLDIMVGALLKAGVGSPNLCWCDGLMIGQAH